MGCSPSAQHFGHHRGHPWQGRGQHIRRNEAPNAFSHPGRQQEAQIQQQRQFATPGPPPNQNVGRVPMDSQALMRYVQIEKDINRLEAMNVVEHLQIKWDALKGLEEEIKRVTEVVLSRREQTLKEKKDVDDLRDEMSVSAYIADQATYDARMSREQEEYLAALNKQELAQKELDAVVQAREGAKAAVKELHGHAMRLQALYKEQDSLLTAIFNGRYGSELEFRLEREQDALSDRQQRVAAAKARWQAGRLLVHHASAQLGYATQRWEFCAGIPFQPMQQRYAVATETRNYLMAACANLRNSQNYMRGIDFPYCKLEEVYTLERAANNIYTDVGTPDRHQHALIVYRAMFQRSAALLQWFDTVIDKTIDRDLQNATEEVFAKKRLLRAERVRLIKAKLVELLGPEGAEAVGLDADANLTDARRLQQQLEIVNQEEMEKLMRNVKVVLPEAAPPSQKAVAPDQSRPVESPPSSSGPPRSQEQSEAQVPPPAGGEPPQLPPPLPPPPPKMEGAPKVEAISLKDLAPPPSQERLFGDIDSIKKQYEIDMEEYQRAQELNRARVEQGLQEKLAARKTRKARKMAQELETEKLLLESGNV